MVTFSPPMRPDMRVPLNTRAGVAQAPTEPGLRALSVLRAIPTASVNPYPWSTGACTASDVVVILQRSGQAVTACQVELKAERAEVDPKVFTQIHMHFVVRGRNLKSSMVENAIKLSHNKYCSATAMLAKTATITHDYEIVSE